MSRNCYHKVERLPDTDPIVRVLIRELNRLEWSWDEFEKRSGVAKHTVLNWRSGRRTPTLSLLRSALNAVQLDLKVTPLGGGD